MAYKKAFCITVQMQHASTCSHYYSLAPIALKNSSLLNSFAFLL